jgi:threonine dehydrogenase-like Zn-dependent dehydrogenase
VGVSPRGSRLPADLFDLHFRELTLLGAYGRGTAFRRVLPLLAGIGAADLVTARLPLARIADAFQEAAAGHGLKTAVAPGETADAG